MLPVGVALVALPFFLRRVDLHGTHLQNLVVGSDLLIVPENIADQVRETIADSTDLSGEEILFNASHNHSGPGGFAPGWVSGVFNGSYRPDFERHLVSVFVEAIEGALRNLEPSRLGGGGVGFPFSLCIPLAQGKHLKQVLVFARK